ncbi:MAG: Crp/Fnr family transcriptional regulator [Rhodothermia bacterium]|nr:Crp/Fnr family transcriptional regulator [Rhodothermia bacterium]
MVFGKLESRQFKYPFHLIQDYHVERNVDIVTAGANTEAVYTSRDGFLKIWRRDDQGKAHILRVLGPGDMMGLEALAQPCYSDSATSLTTANLCEIPVSVLEKVRKREPSVEHELDIRWNRQMQYTETLVAETSVGDPRTRIVKLLNYLSKFAAPSACPHLSRSDMAAMVGISKGTAARVIAELKRASLFKETREHLYFDPERLSSFIS